MLAPFPKARAAVTPLDLLPNLPPSLPPSACLMEERLEERSGDLGLRLATRDLEHHPAPASAQPTSAAAVSRASPISPSSATVPLPVRLTRTESSRSVIVAPKLDEGILKRLRRWIVAFAVVEFDLDMGPVSLTSLTSGSRGASSARVGGCAGGLRQELPSRWGLVRVPPRVRTTWTPSFTAG